MSDDNNKRAFSGIDPTRRSFLQKSAIASGALALGGAGFGTVSAEEHEDGDPDAETDGDHVLMLVPDALEHASVTVVSDEIDWQPWEDGDGYRTHLVEAEFSASHVSPVFVPEDADVGLDEDVQLGEIEELLHGPDDPIDEDIVDDEEEPGENEDDDEPGIGENGEAVLVRISLDAEPIDDENDIEEPDDEEPPEDDEGEDDGILTLAD